MLFLLGVLSLASAPCLHTKAEFRCVEFVGNHDGDTFNVEIQGLPPIFGHNVPVRIRGVDTPEMSGDAPCERRQAAKARSFLYERLSGAVRIDLLNVGRDKYFRILADVVADGSSVSQELVKAGLAVVYDGGTKRKVDWCKVR